MAYLFNLLLMQTLTFKTNKQHIYFCINIAINYIYYRKVSVVSHSLAGLDNEIYKRFIISLHNQDLCTLL